MAEHFLTKTSIDRSGFLEVGGRLALESYPALHAVLKGKVSEEAASLFAEPILSMGNDAAPASVSWYTDHAGEGVPLANMDGAARAAQEGIVSRTLLEIKPLLDDPDHGPLIGAALHVLGRNDIWSVGGQPVIINWGALPEGVGRDKTARSAHFGQTLGRYLPLSVAPPVTDSERASRAPAAASAAAAGAATGAATVAAAGSGVDGAAPPPPPPPEAAVSRGGRNWSWVPLLLLLMLAGGALAWLLLPGTRLFPPEPVAIVVTEEDSLRVALEVNAALRARKAALESSLAGAVCRGDGTLLLPDGRTPEGLLPPRIGDPTDGPGQRTEAAPTPTLSPDPARVVTPGSGSVREITLLDLIEDRTVMVVAAKGDGVGTGSGFFVGPDLVVTNNHVIEGANPSDIYVTNKKLGQIHSATVIKASGSLQESGMDFALLRVAGAQQPAYSVHVPGASLKLQSVIAAGYPGDVLATDQQYKALLRDRDISAVPELTVTDGLINTEQSLSPRTSVLVHSAPISQGNSGGPLIDMCGRVVGINTFVKKGALRNLNFALSAKDLLDFLEGTDAIPTTVTQSCAPQVLRAAVPPAAAQPGGLALPGTEPAEGGAAAPSGGGLALPGAAPAPSGGGLALPAPSGQ